MIERLKKKNRPISFNNINEKNKNINAKILNKIFANRIQKYTEREYIVTKWSLFFFF